MKIGYAFTGSFCTLSKSLEILKILSGDYSIIPIISSNVKNFDTRFGKAEDFIKSVTEICKVSPIDSIVSAEPLGPSLPLDALIIAPCTGNTLAKIALGITDTPVTMAAKAHMRCDRPLIISLASNDALSQNLKNIGTVLTRKNVYFVPFRQDLPEKKPYSLISDFGLIPKTLEFALDNKQLQPILL